MERICDYKGLLKVALAINIVLLGMTLLVFSGIDPGIASYIIFFVDVELLVPLILVTALLVYQCETRVTEDKF